MIKFGIIGYPLGHSFSRGFFTEKFAREGIDAQYLNFEIPDVTMLLDVLRENPELRGLNVTLPHKQAVIPLLDELSDEAREIGAVNVIRIERFDDLRFKECSAQSLNPQILKSSIHLKGFNSDIIGFTDSIRPLLQPHHKKALVLGTGGASKAICVGLRRMGLEWKYVSRNGGQGARGKEQTSCPNNPLAPCPLPLAPLNYSDLTPEVMAEYTVIVNCSPVGMFPKVDEAPAIPYELLTPEHLLFDCVYNPEDTLFLKKGREQGARGKNGLEMLHLQAIASWRFWNEE
ncbi:MAG: shikimate dehydrogenase [Bacteroidaceae bacterium]|nr:shikimate dehydrogenase [Bacteroidaceae bacterium]